MNIEPAELLAKLKLLVAKSKKYLPFGLTILVLILFGFLVFRISQLYQAEPDDDSIQEKQQTINRPRIDEGLIEKIQQLRDQNVQVEALFQEARDNPFEE